MHEQEEEVKMEKFFALIRSFREARNYYRRKGLNELEKKKSNKKMNKMGGGDHQHHINRVSGFLSSSKRISPKSFSL